MQNLSFWIVRTPTGDRPYVSIHKPESYIKHLDETLNNVKAEVYEVHVTLPDGTGETLVASNGGDPLAVVTRRR